MQKEKICTQWTSDQ